MDDLPKTVSITERIVHNKTNVTLHLPIKFDFSPGQFLMIWVPGLDEKPYSIAGRDHNGLMITVRRRGDFSNRLAAMKTGALVGVRGPYGKGFRLREDCCLVAGGIGLACLAPIAERFPGAPILYGENSADNAIYQKRFPNTTFYTVDGSAGRRGFPTDDLESTLRRRQCRMVYCCGPEPMLKKTIEICSTLGVSCQASIERYMKCAQGICGQCACGSVRVCVEGTVFDGQELLENPDFGNRKLDASGTWQKV
jgi:dihydroorotate dehydrogenase electron transfer subunit